MWQFLPFWFTLLPINMSKIKSNNIFLEKVKWFYVDGRIGIFPIFLYVFIISPFHFPASTLLIPWLLWLHLKSKQWTDLSSTFAVFTDGWTKLTMSLTWNIVFVENIICFTFKIVIIFNNICLLLLHWNIFTIQTLV